MPPGGLHTKPNPREIQDRNHVNHWEANQIKTCVELVHFNNSSNQCCNKHFDAYFLIHTLGLDPFPFSQIDSW